MPPRYFWRRVAAFLIDYLLAVLVSLALLLPFVGNTDVFRLDSGPIYAKSCYGVTEAPQSWFDMLEGHRLDGAMVCDTWSMGVPNGKLATLVFDRSQSGAVTSQSSLTFPIDEDGTPVAPLAPQGLIVAAILVLVGGYLLARHGTTPGKRLLGLRVVGAEARPVRGILREAIKFAPALLQGGLGVLFVVTAPSVLSIMTEIGSPVGLGVMGAIFLALVWFYLWPLVRWRGAMRYDRWLGQSVLRR